MQLHGSHAVSTCNVEIVQLLLPLGQPLDDNLQKTEHFVSEGRLKRSRKYCRMLAKESCLAGVLVSDDRLAGQPP